ncbi:helix-turn-helix domain-containing protein [Pseudooceanicola sp. CBS1P-1]|uniref:Helix-turn-helix domain-containing protein n=1 Tax=Pseudooceanicola albus TaxID=2692189 RepID=A0A6L7G5X1_9RHOB|nr:MULTISPECIES: helix-turn-helix transcriptional regulator [Pseudooceanicola]MBT9385526.1 helix-turn-helix domain-containing protein [Pseudooceanicola endophyticus]MXN19062.1 helix-turn-helix domain-containing protein [Pseudooceanicola albus]
MPREGRGFDLTGSRIRERRLHLGMKQADLARAAGISASYLNLIEHNRRRIGGKLLLSLAAALGVEPSALSEGAEAALLAGLRQAAASVPQAGAELERIEEFSGRFPGWAGVVSAQGRRLAALERSVEALSDRMSHDPHLAASLHEVLSTVTAIHAAAGILVAETALEPEWRDRFHRNIAEDSARLAEGARRLVAELEDEEAQAADLATPEDEVEAWLAAHEHHFPALEAGGSVDALLEGETRLGTDTARRLARRLLERYAGDAALLPADRLAAALPKGPLDPGALAVRFGLDPARMMRRLAALPRAAWEEVGQPVPGLVACDASGTLTFRKPLERFALPRFGAACPLWPLFQALSRPMMPLASVVRLAGRSDRVFRIHAIAQPFGPPVPNREPMFEAHMLFQPAPGIEAAATLPRIGITCRICPKPACRGRRDPSILAEVP